MAKVYFTKIGSYSETERINSAAAKLLVVLEKENPSLKFKGLLPIKVHFGEKGNITFIEPKNFEGVINHLKKNGAESFYTDTNVLYKSERTFSETHLAIAKEHGFTFLPIKIADGDHGEENVEIDISKSDAKHFKKCLVGKIIADSNQMLVIAHFKGHPESGFGGAIKQLGMGCAARGGKLAMHANAKPLLNPLKCKKCLTCVKHCPTNACIITAEQLDPKSSVGKKIGAIIPHIDSKKCIGCAACIAYCPYEAMSVNWVSTLPNTFEEKLAEYALAATLNKNGTQKKCVYLLFALNIAKKCDCFGEKMKPIAKDIGVFASTDPVALDKACLDLLRKNEGKKVFGGDHCLDHAEKIGLGSKKYELIEVEA